MFRILRRRAGLKHSQQFKERLEGTRLIVTAAAIHKGIRRSRTASDLSSRQRYQPGRRKLDNNGDHRTWYKGIRDKDRQDEEAHEATQSLRKNVQSRSDMGRVQESTRHLQEHDELRLPKNPRRRDIALYAQKLLRQERADLWTSSQSETPIESATDQSQTLDAVSSRLLTSRDPDSVSVRAEQSENVMTRQSTPRRKRRKDEIPQMPYTTPASQFLYGTTVVEAAIRSRARTLYNIYIHIGEQKKPGSYETKLAERVKGQGGQARFVSGKWLSLMDRMSSGRPHNGLILEASPLKRPDVLSLMRVEEVGSPFEFLPASQSKEDLAINGTDNRIVPQSKQRRYPFVLLLDGVLDTGNLGNILRSAHFLGVDAVAIARSCAHLTPVAIKASGGSVETLPLLSVSDTSGFIVKSQEAGWRAYASIAPRRNSKESKATRGKPHFNTSSMVSPLAEAPCILMIGGEGSGLKLDLQKKAEGTVSIPSRRAEPSTVDSLNVGAAAGILAEAFLSNIRQVGGSKKGAGGTLW